MWRGLLLCWCLPAIVLAATYTADVAVYGDTSAAVTAAVQVVRQGRTAIIVAPSKHLGGLSSGGLSATDVGDPDGIGGLSYEFYRRVNQLRGSGWNWRFEPHLAERVFDDLVAEAGVTVLREAGLDRVGGVDLVDGRIAAIRTKAGDQVEAPVFIDASYEGDLMAAAGVSFIVGREARSLYGETHNGVSVDHTDGHQFDADVDPYVVPGDPASGVLPGIESEPPEPDGSADERLQAYCFRVILTDESDNRRAWSEPPAYDPARYELLRRYLIASGTTKIGKIIRTDTDIPGNKKDINNWGPFSLDLIGGSDDYPEADDASRAAIVEDHRRYILGLFWFLRSHPDVPQSMTNWLGNWGLPKDEFADSGGFPHQIYVREARRMIGEYVMRQQDCAAETTVPDPIGMGSYAMDSHHVRRYIDADGHVRNEGNMWLNSLTETYSIAYGSIVPRATECENLLVACAVSASHIAYGSIRMEPVFMVLGQACGAAGVAAVDESVAVQDIDRLALQERLRRYGMRLHVDQQPSTEPFVGFIEEAFDHGPARSDLAYVSGVVPGWSGPWENGDAIYDADLQGSSGSVGYHPPVTAPLLVSGGAGGAGGDARVTERPIAGGGMSGTLWLSCLMRLPALDADAGAWLWLDRIGTPGMQAARVGLGADGRGRIVLDDDSEQVAAGDPLAAATWHLLLARLQVGAGADQIDCWLDPANAGSLGAADVSLSGIDLCGTSFDGVGLSFGPGGGAIDALRLSNTATAAADVRGTASSGAAPTITAGPTVQIDPADARRRILAVTASDADDPDASLIYQWQVLDQPTAAPVVQFSEQDNNAAATTTATFGQAGVYQLRVLVSDGEQSDQASLTFTVEQTGQTLQVVP